MKGPSELNERAFGAAWLDGQRLAHIDLNCQARAHCLIRKVAFLYAYRYVDGQAIEHGDSATQLSFMETAKLAELAAMAARAGHRFVRVRPGNQIEVGANPLDPSHMIDFGKEEIVQIDRADSSTILKSPVIPTRRSSRRGGDYFIVIKGEKIECISLKELLAEGLKHLEHEAPGTLEELSGIMPRSKRIVARDPAKLFVNPALAEKYAEKLFDGWWFGTNNSANETIVWLQRGAEIAGLNWGTDIRSSIG